VSLSEILKKGFWVLLFRSLGALLTFFSLLLIARMYGANEYGLFSLGLTLMTVLSVFVRFGLDNVVLKRVASLNDLKPELSEGYIVSALKIVFLSSLLVTFFFFFWAESISIDIFDKPGLISVLQSFSFLILPLSLVFIFAEYNKAVLKPVFSSFWQVVFPPVLFLCLFFLSIFMGYEISLEQIVQVWVTGFVVSCLVFLMRKKPALGAFYKKTINWIDLLKQGFPMVMVSSGALVLAWSDVIILGILGASEDVGVYSAASRVVMVTALLLIAINAITAPKYSKLYSEKKIDELERIAKMSTRILTLLVLIPTLMLLFFSEEIMGLFGKEFQVGAILLATLAVGQFVNVSCGSVGYLLTMTGKEKKLSQIMLCTAVVNILLSIFLYYLFGVWGVALATASSIILWNFWAVYEVKKHLGFFTFPTMRFKYK